MLTCLEANIPFHIHRCPEIKHTHSELLIVVAEIFAYNDIMGILYRGQKWRLTENRVNLILEEYYIKSKHTEIDLERNYNFLSAPREVFHFTLKFIMMGYDPQPDRPIIDIHSLERRFKLDLHNFLVED